jgi:Cytochrome c
MASPGPKGHRNSVVGFAVALLPKHQSNLWLLFPCINAMDLLLLVLVGALPAIAAAPEPSALAVGVYAHFEHEPPKAVVEAIHQEVSSIMAPIGLRMVWRSLDRDANEVWGALASIRFKGMCSSEDLTVYPPYPFVLGQTHIVDGKASPFIDIHCNAVRAMLASWLSTVELERRDRLFGRAVARVVAHELYHALAKSKHHGSRGIGERAYSVEDLIIEEFRFENSQVRGLLSSVLPSFLQVAGAFPRFASLNLILFIKSGCVGCHATHGEGTAFGPALGSVASSYDFTKLSRRLNDKETLMYKRARRLGVLWPPLADKDVESLTAFVRGLRADSDLATATGGRGRGGGLSIVAPAQ